MKDGHTEEFLLKQARRLELYTSMRKQGMTYKEIADEVGVCQEQVA